MLDFKEFNWPFAHIFQENRITILETQLEMKGCVGITQDL